MEVSSSQDLSETSFQIIETKDTETSLSEFLVAINQNDESILIRGLRNFLKHISATSESFVPGLLKLYLSQSPECREILDMLSSMQSNNTSKLYVTILGVLNGIVSTKEILPAHSILRIARNILRTQAKRFVSTLSNALSPILVKAVLRLLTSIVDSSSSAAQSVHQFVDIEMKCFPKLLGLPVSSKSGQVVKRRKKVKFDTRFRGSCLNFVLTLLESESSNAQRTILKSRNLMNAILNDSISLDSAETTKRILTVMENILGRSRKIEMRAKQYCISSSMFHISKFLRDEDRESFTIQFLRVLFVHKSSSMLRVDDRTTLSVLRAANPLVSLEQRRFVLDLLSVSSSSCVESYCKNIHLNLEPDLSVPFMSSAAFAMQMLTLIKTKHPLMNKSEFSRGLQHKKTLVQFVTLQVLVATLKACNQEAKLRTHCPDPQILFRNAIDTNRKEQRDIWIRTLSLVAIRYYWMRMPNMMRNIRFDFRRLVDLIDDDNNDDKDYISINKETARVLLQVGPARCDWLRDKKSKTRLTRMISDVRYHDLLVNILTFEIPLWSHLKHNDRRVVARALLRDTKPDTLVSSLLRAVRDPFEENSEWSKLVQETFSRLSSSLTEVKEVVKDYLHKTIPVTRETMCALPVRQFLRQFAKMDKSSREFFAQEHCPSHLVVPVIYGLLRCCVDTIELCDVDKIASKFASACSHDRFESRLVLNTTVRVLELALELKGTVPLADAVLSKMKSSYLLDRAELRRGGIHLKAKSTFLRVIDRVSSHLDRDVAEELSDAISKHPVDILISSKRGLQFTRSVLRSHYDNAWALRVVRHVTSLINFDTQDSTMWEILITHSKFLSVLTSHTDEIVRYELLSLLSRHVVVENDSSKILRCFLVAYSASTSRNDRIILNIIHKLGGLETFAYRFGENVVDTNNNINSNLDWLLDTTRPKRIRLSIETLSTKQPHELSYDPNFLLPLLLYMFDMIDIVPVRRLVESGLLGYIVVCMSSPILDTRTKAYDLLARYFQQLELQQSQGLLAGSGFRERPQIHLLLDTFRGAIEQPYAQISPLLTVFVAEALPILLRPGHAVYPQINNFLLARPCLDLTDVPMYYSTFNSGRPTARAERIWILKILTRGLQSDSDVKLCARRHCFTATMAVLKSEQDDKVVSNLCREFLIRAASLSAGTDHLLRRAGVGAWLMALKDDENWTDRFVSVMLKHESEEPALRLQLQAVVRDRVFKAEQQSNITALKIENLCKCVESSSVFLTPQELSIVLGYVRSFFPGRVDMLNLFYAASPSEVARSSNITSASVYMTLVSCVSDRDGFLCRFQGSDVITRAKRWIDRMIEVEASLVLSDDEGDDDDDDDDDGIIEEIRFQNVFDFVLGNNHKSSSAAEGFYDAFSNEDFSLSLLN